MLVLSQYQNVFGHPKWLYGFFPSTVLPPLKTNEDHRKIDGIIEDDSFPFKMVPFLGQSGQFWPPPTFTWISGAARVAFDSDGRVGFEIGLCFFAAKRLFF